MTQHFVCLLWCLAPWDAGKVRSPDLVPGDGSSAREHEKEQINNNCMLILTPPQAPLAIGFHPDHVWQTVGTVEGGARAS